MNAKQKWLAAGEVVDSARKAWLESLDFPGEDYSAAWVCYRAAREVEIAAHRDLLAELESTK